MRKRVFDSKTEKTIPQGPCHATEGTEIVREVRGRPMACGPYAGGLPSPPIAICRRTGVETLVHQLMPIAVDDDAAMLRQAPKSLRLYALKCCFPAVLVASV